MAFQAFLGEEVGGFIALGFGPNLTAPCATCVRILVRLDPFNVLDEIFSRYGLGLQDGTTVRLLEGRGTVTPPFPIADNIEAVAEDTARSRN